MNRVRDEVWACKDISGPKKQLWLISLAIFWVIWKEKNKRTFHEIEEDINRIRARWFQTISFFL